MDSDKNVQAVFEQTENLPSFDGIYNIDNEFILVGDKWNAIAYGNGKYIVVGFGGFVSSSTDGKTWTTPEKIGTTTWLAITYANGKFIMAGYDGYVSSSTDGKEWTTPEKIDDNIINMTKGWKAIIYGDGKYVMAGLRGYVSSSTDGKEWTTPKRHGTDDWEDLAFGYGKFEMVGHGVSTSTDGITWSNPHWLFPGACSAIVYNNGTFVAGGIKGNVCSSKDGIIWTIAKQIGTDVYSWRAAAYGHGKYILGGTSGYVSFSTDGITWTTPKQIGTTRWNWEDVIAIQ